MIDLVAWSFFAALLPIVLHVCVRILTAVAGLLAWRGDRPALESSRSPHPSAIREPAAGACPASPIVGGVRGGCFPAVVPQLRQATIIHTAPPSRFRMGRKI